MTKAEFIKELADIVMVDASELKADTDLTQFEAWDSTAVLNIIVLLDEHGITVDEEKIPDCKTIQDALDLAGIKD